MWPLNLLQKKQTDGTRATITDGQKQDLDVYWDPEMAKLLDEWGEAHVWKEVQLLFWNTRGNVLDIACGTGKTMQILDRFPSLQLYGCDISDLLVQKAVDRGIPTERLKVADATKLDCYSDKQFAHAYSIGSLEHFTEEGINAFISESARITSGFSCHMIPVSRSGKNEGWTKTWQSFFNNSEAWWKELFLAKYSYVETLPSGWDDAISYGVWVVCK